MNVQKLIEAAEAAERAVQALESVAVCLGRVEARKERGDYSRDDSIMERGFRQAIADYRSEISEALRTALQGLREAQAEPVAPTAKRVSADRAEVLAWLDARGLSVTVENVNRARAALATPPTTDAPAQGVAKLAAFGAWAAREFRDSLADVDGGSAQDAMERLGVIVKRVVTEPCGDACVCAEYGPFPHDCYTFPADVAAVMDAPTQEGAPK